MSYFIQKPQFSSQKLQNYSKKFHKNQPQITLESFKSLTSSEYILITFSIADDVKEIKTHTKVNEG